MSLIDIIARWRFQALFIIGALVIFVFIGLPLGQEIAFSQQIQVDQMMASFTNNSSWVKEEYHQGNLVYYSNPYIFENCTIVDKWQETNVLTFLWISSEWRIRLSNGEEVGVSREFYSSIEVGSNVRIEKNRNKGNMTVGISKEID